MARAPKTEDEREEPRYRAPALEKGLDVLEAITRSGHPMTLGMITQHLGRSTGELFRMIQVLEYRGFIELAPNGTGYVPTTKLFSLGMEQAPIKSLLEVALPIMRRVADEAEQSCHLALRAGGEIVIAARMEAAGLIGFSVRLGYRRPIPTSGSGAVLYAFQPSAVRERWEKDFGGITEADLARFRRRADKVARQGYDQHPSDVVSGIVDLSAPVVRGDVAAAALTMPFVQKLSMAIDADGALGIIRRAAADISSELALGDFRI
ncbi:helix-turn-helix domain-containing protein [Sphingomonas sp.]|uniref:IclR family transcriptional regulator n=1 Tax=Sphingomonas sp. TaxID=28214 RepID=UPI0025F700B6|nr:helix-turn-helix domain-containing protein [Sphingomonas sp.]